MRAIAELIETAFTGQLDDDGLRMIRWMKLLGRARWIGWMISFYLLPPAARPMGFVWESDGRVVGNSSLLPVEGHRDRWVLVNMAVHPEYRRRGIARELVRASMAFVRQRGGRRLLLQVDVDSHGAQDLYTSTGFKPIATRTTWIGRGDRLRFGEMETGLTRRRARDEWEEQWLLVRRVHPEGIVWPYPPAKSLFQPRGLTDVVGLGPGRHWVWSEQGSLLASLTARWGSDLGAWRLYMVVTPEARERVERSILAFALTDLPIRGDRIILEYPYGVAGSQLRELGFYARRNLTWMMHEFKD